MPCRVNQRRKRTGRYVLEGLCHPISTFATITYDEKSIPKTGNGVPTLDSGEFQRLLKLVRHDFAVRFAGVGEYGDRYGRPHYHALFFGAEPETVEASLAKRWGTRDAGKGYCDVRWAEYWHFPYMAGYVTKKMTNAKDPRLLDGQAPEFMRQSLKPAIGCSTECLDRLENLCYTVGVSRLIAETADVPNEFRYDGKRWPLDTTVRRKLRERLGLPRVDVARGFGLPPLDAEEQERALQKGLKLERRYSRGVL